MNLLHLPAFKYPPLRNFKSACTSGLFSTVDLAWYCTWSSQAKLCSQFLSRTILDPYPDSILHGSQDLVVQITVLKATHSWEIGG